MRFHRNILILLSIFILSCSAGNPNIRSISEGNVYSFLEKAPKAEQHPNAGADLLYSYSYVEFFEDGTSVTRVLGAIKYSTSVSQFRHEIHFIPRGVSGG